MEKMGSIVGSKIRLFGMKMRIMSWISGDELAKFLL